MVVSNLFLWYDEGQDLFSERKNLQFLFQNVSKKEEKIRKHSDEKKKKEFIQKVTGILYKYGDIESTPMLDKRIQDIYNEYYEEETDYVALKHKYNQYMLEREDEIKEHLKEAKNIKDYIKFYI